MYKPPTRTSIFAAHSSVKDLPPLAPPDEEIIVMTAPMIRHTQRDAPKKKKSKPTYLPGEKLLKKVGKLSKPEDDLDLAMIGDSVNEMVRRMRL